jgi:hypothetical protein
MSRKMLFMVALLFAVLCLLSSVAMGKCEKVNMNEKSCEYPAECNGYDSCEVCQYEGAPNASVSVFWNESDWTYLENAMVLSVDAVYETNQGEIWADAVAMIHLDALMEFDSGLATSGYFYGGTGKYEAATGWLSGAYVPQKGTLLSFYGEICWPDE